MTAAGDAALQIECPVPQCRAQPGQPCTIRRYRGPDARHRERIEAAKPKPKPRKPPPWLGGARHQAWRVRLALICMKCDKPITRAAPGHAIVDRRAAASAAAGAASRRVPWRLVHTACQDAPTPHDFRLRADDLSTLHRLVHASGRMMPKRWAAGTDWTGLVDYLLEHTRRAAAHEELATQAAARRRTEAAKRAVQQQDRDC